MTKMKVQEYLEENSLQDLKKNFGINYKILEKNYNYYCKNRILLCYDHIESKPGEIVDECRGLILDPYIHTKVPEDSPLGETSVVCRPFKRFYNYGQPGAAIVNLDDARIYEKLDGSLIKVYYCNDCGRWHTATKQTFHGDQKIIEDEEHSPSFSDLANSLIPFMRLNQNITYLYELVGPENKNVVSYLVTDIFLIGAIENASGEEHDIFSIAKDQGVKTPAYWKFNKIEDILKIISERSGAEFEGVVACDSSFNRVKIKHPEYNAYNRLKDKASSSSKNLLEIILREGDDDAITVLPDHLVKKLLEIKDLLLKYSKKIESFFEENKGLSRKEFAILVNQNELPMGALMWLYSGKGTKYFDWAKEAGLKSDASLKSILIEIGWKTKNDNSEDDNS